MAKRYGHVAQDKVIADAVKTDAKSTPTPAQYRWLRSVPIPYDVVRAGGPHDVARYL